MILFLHLLPSANKEPFPLHLPLPLSWQGLVQVTLHYITLHTETVKAIDRFFGTVWTGDKQGKRWFQWNSLSPLHTTHPQYIEYFLYQEEDGIWFSKGWIQSVVLLLAAFVLVFWNLQASFTMNSSCLKIVQFWFFQLDIGEIIVIKLTILPSSYVCNPIRTYLKIDKYYISQKQRNGTQLYFCIISLTKQLPKSHFMQKVPFWKPFF